MKHILRELFVTMLYKQNKLYHFDDNACDVVDMNDKRVFSDAEAVVINRLRDALYDEELFTISLRLTEKDV